MVLADMGIAWLARGMIENELRDKNLVSLESRLGFAGLDVVLYSREDSRSETARAIIEIIKSLRQGEAGVEKTSET
jgi:DNA-binding transcriptional LysR family regulator